MRVQIIGRLGKDPETQYTADGTCTARFSLAEDSGKDKAGNKLTDWWDVVAFRGTAEVIGKWATKGTQVAVWGKASWREYVGKDGQPRKALNVVAQEVQLLSRPTESSTTQAAAAVVRGAAQSYEIPDDLPF